MFFYLYIISNYYSKNVTLSMLSIHFDLMFVFILAEIIFSEGIRRIVRPAFPSIYYIESPSPNWLHFRTQWKASAQMLLLGDRRCRYIYYYMNGCVFSYRELCVSSGRSWKPLGHWHWRRSQFSHPCIHGWSAHTIRCWHFSLPINYGTYHIILVPSLLYV